MWGGGAAVSAGVWGAARWLLWQWRHQRWHRDAYMIEVSVPPNVEPPSATAWWTHQVGLLRPRWKRLLVGQPHLAFEYLADEAGARIQLWVPGSIPAGLMEKTVQSAWPGATLNRRPVQPPMPSRSECVGGRVVLARPEHFPLTAEHKSDPLRALLGAFSGLARGERAVVQVLARPVTGRRLNHAHRAAAALRGGGSAAPQAWLFDLLTPGPAATEQVWELTRRFPERAEQVRAILKKAAQPRFEVQVRYAVSTTARPGEATRDRLRGRAHSLAATFALFSSGHQYLRRRRLFFPARCIARRRLCRGYLLSASELAALAHLPLDPDAPGIARAGARPVAPSPLVPVGGNVRVLGDADAGHPRPVGMPIPGARQHVHVLGQTGVGKSTLLASMILDDVHARRGALVIDPKGDLVADVLDRLPQHALSRTVLFDPGDPTPPPSVNVLAGPDPVFAVDSIITIFRRCFSSSWGPRLDDLLRSACLTLTQVNGPKATLAQVPRLLADTAYRARITAQLDDELLAGFWADYDELSPAGRAATIGPVMNKLRTVLLRPFVRDALSASESTVHLGRHLDKGGLVLARLPKGVLGEDAARLFGSLLLAHTWQAITRRALLPEDQRPDAAAYVDECHNFLNLPGSIGDVLAEARGYRFSLVLAHQHLTQLPKDLREAVSADARNKLYFTTSPEDAHDLARHVAPLLTAHDLSHLGAYQAAARLITGTQQTPAFTFRTRPLPAATPGRQDEARKAARQWSAQRAPHSARKPKQPRKAALRDPRQR
ncbi:type IV secretory system conjugative DNA transfer family protein [Actinomadura gamaensis]|uniref:Type IV secretory system conjugative DNA transfer family protein n=1 Tax=Actinomadura gamaensis TaxID=1763541 RepID=A0ABV9UAS7_9ACTN